jgi:ribonucleoside-diphosphate reductase alpha chain
MTFDERSALGIYTAEERQRQLETGSYELVDEERDEVSDVSEAESLRSSEPARPAPVEAASAKPVKGEAHTTAEMMELLTGTSVDAPLCFTCGTKMRPSGSCYVCEGCGSTSGCS